MSVFQSSTVLLLVFVMGCSSDRDVPADVEEPKIVKVALQLSWSVSPEHAPFLLGKTVVFPTYGIDLALEPSRGSNDSLTSVAAGTFPFVIASAESLVLARDQGVPVRSVLQLYRTSPAVVFSIDGSTLLKPEDLIDKRVGIIPTSTVTTQLNLLLAEHEINHSEDRVSGAVNYVIAVMGGAAQLATGQIDALTHYTNYAAARFTAEGAQVSELKFDEHGISTYSAGIIVSDETIQQDDKDLVQRFVCATMESHELAIKEPDQALAAYMDWAKSTGLVDDSYPRLSIERTHTLLTSGLEKHRVGYHDAEGWRQTLELMRAATSKTDRMVRLIDPAYLYDLSFYNQADSTDLCEKLKLEK